MANEIKKITGRALRLAGDDIDTDRIIPARFMRCVTFDGLGKYAFFDQRFDSKGKALEHPLNTAKAEDSPILIVGRNFGCGSSREHAPQALYRFGFRGIIGQSFAEIFAGNCVSLGFPAVVIEGQSYDDFIKTFQSDPDSSVSIDLEDQLVKISGKKFPFQMPQSSLKSLLDGKWDSMAELLSNKEAIEKKYQELPYLNQFTGV
ncbi:MAG: 3-isopropylmalate dehydratase small subunit [Spirochaetales bacterium]|nr:3-isopropylmalate dehydratase small subunit [Spirochaetales bacterium]